MGKTKAIIIYQDVTNEEGFSIPNFEDDAPAFDHVSITSDGFAIYSDDKIEFSI